MTPRTTKIVATLGPASSDPALLEAMIRAGLDVVRLNFSHGEADRHRERAQAARAAAERAGRVLAIMVDLQGPKIRIGAMRDDSAMLETGTPFVLDPDRSEDGDAGGASLSYTTLARDVQPGDTLLLDDGMIELQVSEVGKRIVHTVVKVGGRLSSHKGLNRRGGGLAAPALTPKDEDDLRSAVALDADYLAVSFPGSAADIQNARELLARAGVKPGEAPLLIAKIERSEAVRELAGILAASDGIMVARGDLALEVGNAAVPALQKKMIRMARKAGKLVITATQMMESMIEHPVPTRAEVSDVANAVLDGTDAVMLSAETAVGRYPLETVRQMATICEAAEELDPVELDDETSSGDLYRIDRSIAMGALFSAHRLGARAIVALTWSGSTARWMSRQRTRIPIHALTPNAVALRRMALYRGVHPMLIPVAHDREEELSNAVHQLRQQDLLRPGDIFAITCGETMGASGGTNMMVIRRVS